MKQKRHTYFQLILSLLLVISLLTGCLVPSAPSLPEAPAAESSQPDTHSADPLAASAARAAFDALTQELFLDEVSQDLLALHYTLANPAAYGIIDYPRAFEAVSSDTAKQAISDAKSLKQQLNSIDSRLLTREQLLTYTILSSYINTLLAGEGFELYEQPLSSSLGIQAQLPIILSEYAFYSKQDVEDYLTLLSSIDEYFKSICDFEKQKAENGLGLCNAVIDRILDSCSAYLLDADHNFLTQTFENRLNELPELTEKEKKEYWHKIGDEITSDPDVYDDLESAFRSAVRKTVMRVSWNYRTAIPVYFPSYNKMSILLPLAFNTKKIAEVALVVEYNSTSKKYTAPTILTLPVAYSNARLVCKPESDWLNQRIFEAAELEGLDINENDNS